MQDNLIESIKERMTEFSKSQRLIGGFITEHYEKAAYMTASRLGSTVGVSESTVVRFAIEMGYEGYPEMQKALQNYSKTRLTALQRLDITNNRIDSEHVLKSGLMQDIDRIRMTVEMTDEDSFVQAVNTSGIYQQLIRIDKGDVLIAFSFPRYCQSTANAAKYAASCGAQIVAITDSAASPLGQLADHVLLAKSDMASFADSLAAPLSLINAIIVAVGMKKRDKLETTLARLETMWDENGVYNRGA